MSCNCTNVPAARPRIDVLSGSDLTRILRLRGQYKWESQQSPSVLTTWNMRTFPITSSGLQTSRIAFRKDIRVGHNAVSPRFG
jgi:hypothetical protein